MNFRIKTSFWLSLIFFKALSSYAQNPVQDSSFEDGTPNSTWTETSTNFDSPLCDYARCGDCGGECGARTGNWYGWFGGVAALEEGTLEQAVTIPVSTDTTWFIFYFSIALAGGSGTEQFAAMIDGDTLFYATDGDSAQYAPVGGNPTYYQIKIDASVYADDSSHQLKFWSLCTDVAATTNFLIDDISIRGVPVVFIEEEVQTQVSLYPNPASDEIMIHLNVPSPRNIKIEMMNLMGTTLFSKNLSNTQSGKLSIDVRDFPRGAYFVKIYDRAGSTEKKVVLN